MPVSRSIARPCNVSRCATTLPVVPVCSQCDRRQSLGRRAAARSVSDASVSRVRGQDVHPRRQHDRAKQAPLVLTGPRLPCPEHSRSQPTCLHEAGYSCCICRGLAPSAGICEPPLFAVSSVCRALTPALRWHAPSLEVAALSSAFQRYSGLGRVTGPGGEGA